MVLSSQGLTVLLILSISINVIDELFDEFIIQTQADRHVCPGRHDAVSLLSEAACMTMMEEAASQLERDHVHSVYDKIAPYFNDRRYKAWPKVRQFLLDLQPGSIVADVGRCHFHKLPSCRAAVLTVL